MPINKDKLKKGFKTDCGCEVMAIKEDQLCSYSRSAGLQIYPIDAFCANFKPETITEILKPEQDDKQKNVYCASLLV